MIEENKIYHCDNLDFLPQLEDESVNVILTDPPYLYLKNQKLDRPFDESRFFSECKRVLKKDGFIVLFGRGTSFYRWNTMLADMGFVFKEEIIWNKSYCTSPLMNLSRVHETISIFTKKNGTINKVKVPYLEMKGHDIDAICVDLKRFLSGVKNEKSLNAILDFLENNRIKFTENRTDNHYIVNGVGLKDNDRSVRRFSNFKNGQIEKSIIRTDRIDADKFTKYGVNTDNRKSGDRSGDIIQSICFGLNEKTVIKEIRDHYTAIHPTQKPVRLLERLLALVSKEGDLVIDPFSGSGSTAIACYNQNRRFIGCEIDGEYYEASLERLNKETKQMKLAI